VRFHDATEDFQRRLIERALQACRHNLGATATALGLSRHALRHQLLKLGIQPNA
jgi:DNA-binding NtrC family response regulator